MRLFSSIVHTTSTRTSLNGSGQCHKIPRTYAGILLSQLCRAFSSMRPAGRSAFLIRFDRQCKTVHASPPHNLQNREHSLDRYPCLIKDPKYSIKVYNRSLIHHFQ